MANPRELAEQAFALLEEALRASETRTATLQDELERHRALQQRSVAEQIETLSRRLDESERQRTHLEQELGRQAELLASRTVELEGAREQIAGLELELRDEKECTDNLSEVANERRGRITQLEDRLAEAEERYEEARWRLGKAQHFERLVKRRKPLVKALIKRIRQRDKANTALKAGLDGLRRFKAASEARQHELLARLDKMKAKIKEQEETIARHQGATVTAAELETSHGRIAELERRIEDQVEIIQTLEEELKTAKALQHVRAESGSEVERLRGEVERLQREIDAKSEIVAQLESDSDLRQRKLAQLRSSETETQRLKSKVKEQEATIANLTEAVDGWRRKYEFMSTESPTEYPSAAEK